MAGLSLSARAALAVGAVGDLVIATRRGLEHADAGEDEEQVLIGGGGGFEGVAEVGAVGPAVDDRRHGRPEIGAAAGGGVGDQLPEGGGEIRRGAGRFAQVAHGAAALQIGQRGDGVGV